MDIALTETHIIGRFCNFPQQNTKVCVRVCVCVCVRACVRACVRDECVSVIEAVLCNLCVSASCTSLFCYHIRTVSHVRHSSGTLPFLIHVSSSLFVQLIPLSPAAITISTCISSIPGALPTSSLSSRFASLYP